jgi:hypothetical protein
MAPVHSSLWKCLPALPLLRQRAGSHCVNRADRVVCHYVHDPLDRVSAAAALGAAAEVVIDLTHPQPLRRIRKRGPKLMVTEYIARADDHDLSQPTYPKAEMKRTGTRPPVHPTTSPMKSLLNTIEWPNRSAHAVICRLPVDRASMTGAP